MQKWWVVSLVLALSACAGNQPMGEAQRLSPEELAKLTAPQVPKLSLEEIIALSKQGMAADEVIATIKESGSQYALTPTQGIDLSKQGVDGKVLDFIQAEHEKARLNQLAEEIHKRDKAAATREAHLRIQMQNVYMNAPFFYPHPFYGYGSRPFGHFYWGPSFYDRHRR